MHRKFKARFQFILVGVYIHIKQKVRQLSISLRVCTVQTIIQLKYTYKLDFNFHLKPNNTGV